MMFFEIYIYAYTSMHTHMHKCCLSQLRAIVSTTINQAISFVSSDDWILRFRQTATVYTPIKSVFLYKIDERQNEKRKSSFGRSLEGAGTLDIFLIIILLMLIRF